MVTYPEERRKGYGSMLMEWGMATANKMGLEVLVEASDQGYPLYKKFGLRSLEKVALDTLIDSPSNTWKRLESDLRETTLWWMWKPSVGIYEEGKTPLPWVKQPEST